MGNVFMRKTEDVFKKAKENKGKIKKYSEQHNKQRL